MWGADSSNLASWRGAGGKDGTLSGLCFGRVQARSCDSDSGASFSSKDRNPSSLNSKDRFQHRMEE